MSDTKGEVLKYITDWRTLVGFIVLIGEGIVIGVYTLATDDPYRQYYPLAGLALLALALIASLVTQVLLSKQTVSAPPAATDPKDLTYMGRWSCEWTIEHPEDRAVEDIVDSIELERSVDGAVIGKGFHLEEGSYSLSGTESNWGLSLIYRKSGTEEHILGSIVLEKYRTNSVLHGRWLQIPSEGEILIGKTTWEKVEDT